MKFIATKSANYQLFARDPEIQYFPDGRTRQIRPALVAEFGDASSGEISGAEGLIMNDVHGQYGSGRAADIRGFFFDSEEAQERHGWTDEERQFVEQRLQEVSVPDGDVKVWTKPVPVPPWPTYDKMHHNAIPTFAEQSGMAGVALDYELRTKNRPDLVKKLRELADLEVGEGALTAA